MPTATQPPTRRPRRRDAPGAAPTGVPARPAAMRMVARFPPPTGPWQAAAAPSPSRRRERPARRRADDDASREGRSGRHRDPAGVEAGRRRDATRRPAPGADPAVRSPLWLGLLVGGVLAGCATNPVPPRDTAALAARPAAEPAGRTVSLANELGRAALRERRFDEALHWYDRAVGAHPDLAEAHNGRAVALAALGRLDEAETVVSDALARGLDSPDLRANQDWLARHRPSAVDPAATDAVAVAAATPAPSDDLAAGSAATAAAATIAMPTAAPSQPTDPVGPLDPVDPVDPVTTPAGDAAAPPAVVPMPASTPGSPAARTLRLEVSNGTGIEGLARRTARALAAARDGVAPSRVTNHPHFDVAQTELQVRADADARMQRALVREVARTLGLSVAVVRVTTLAPGIDARLVIGHDSRAAAVPVAQRPGERRG